MWLDRGEDRSTIQAALEGGAAPLSYSSLAA